MQEQLSVENLRLQRLLAAVILYEADINGEYEYVNVLNRIKYVQELISNDDQSFVDIELTEQFKRKIKGVIENKVEIDEIINNNLETYRIDRLPKIGVSIIRLAVYEMKYEKKLDQAIVINEAVLNSNVLVGEKRISRIINSVLTKVSEND